MSRTLRSLAGVVVLVLLASTLLSGCVMYGGNVVTGSGRTVTQDYDFSGFTKVSIGSAFQADIKQGESYATSVTVDDNLQQYLDVRVDGDTLRIGLKPAISLGLRNTTLRAQITMPDLDGS